MRTEYSSPSESVLTAKANNDDQVISGEAASDNFDHATKINNGSKNHQRCNTDYNLNSLQPILETQEMYQDAME